MVSHRWGWELEAEKKLKQQHQEQNGAMLRRGGGRCVAGAGTELGRLQWTRGRLRARLSAAILLFCWVVKICQRNL